MTVGAIETPQLSAGILRAIDRFLEDFYEEGKTKAAGRALTACEMDTTQVRGLENIIVSTTRFSEIINYIKNQIGKEKKEKKWRAVGEELLSQLETVEARAREISAEDPAVKMEVKLRLARGWARQVVAHYFYDTNRGGGRP